MLNKKADGGITAIIIIVIIIVFLGWLINLGSRECNSNKDCSEDNYCGSDFSCHQHPVINTEVNQISITLPIILICITLIILAVIWKWETIFKRNTFKLSNSKNSKGLENSSNFQSKKETKEEKPSEETAEAYYTSQFQYSAK